MESMEMSSTWITLIQDWTDNWNKLTNPSGARQEYSIKENCTYNGRNAIGSQITPIIQHIPLFNAYPGKAADGSTGNWTFPKI